MRREAYSDDAKDRIDETHHGQPRIRDAGRRGRARWPASALVGGVVVVLLAVGATAAWLSSRDEDPSAASPGPDTPVTAGAPPSATASDAGTTTGLPLEPTDQDVTYAGVIRCVQGGDFLLSQCPSVFPDTLTCPSGLCTIGFFVGPSLSSLGPNDVAVTFRAGDPTVLFRGSNESEPCPGQLAFDGTRQPDGGYEIRIVNGARAGEGDGSCSAPSDNVFEISLAAPN